MTVECLVCGKQTEVTHMGMNACRACTVFYKRNHKKSDKLVCVNGSYACLDYGKFWCRKCRLERFQTVLRTAWGEDTSKLACHISRIPVSPERHVPSRVSPPRSPKVFILDSIRANHRTLSISRCVAELALRGIDMNAQDMSEENFPIVPCTYQFMEEATKILIPGLFHFSEDTFPDFQKLKPADKWLLIRNYEKIFHCVDAELRTLRKFGKRSANIWGTYTTCMYLNYVEHYFSDCPNKRSILPASKTLHDFLTNNVSELKKQIHLTDPSEEELLALIGLALWSVENMESSDEILELSARYRTEIMSELCAHYRKTIGEVQGASRIGTILCLLQGFRVRLIICIHFHVVWLSDSKKCNCFQSFVMTMRSDYDIYFMLGAYDDSTIMYKLPVL
uniref:Nuclear receptor domain-containing protein n=1 Tax=Pristionchus pacificus TaxID=54126 RepID=A0A8R1ZA92_PRIPA